MKTAKTLAGEAARKLKRLDRTIAVQERALMAMVGDRFYRNSKTLAYNLRLRQKLLQKGD